MKKKVYEILFRTIMGWRIEGIFDPELQKCVIIVVPHTSAFDFIIGVLTRGILQQKMHFVAKKELFVFPFAAYFKWMGGQPLDRKRSEGKVAAIGRIFETQDVFRLAIAPEGTRGRVEEWKSGFYHIAKEAGVPIVPVAFDYKNKKVVLHEPFHPTSDQEQDFKFLYRLFQGVIGRVASRSF